MDDQAPLNLRVGLSIYPYHEVAIQEVLKKLREDCPARFILLADTSGQLITIEGDRGEIDLPSLSCLVAGDFIASKEIARMTRTYDSCQLIVREGKEFNIFIAEIGHFLVLFVIVLASVPMGWARLLILEASERIGRILATTPPHFQGDTFESKSDDVQTNEIEEALNSIFKGVE